MHVKLIVYNGLCKSRKLLTFKESSFFMHLKYHVVSLCTNSVQYRTGGISMQFTRDSVIKALHNIANDSQFDSIQVGLFGSYARNEQTNHSDIDIVLKSTQPLYLVYDGIEDKLQTYLKEMLGIDCDVVDYSDLEADYEEAKELGIEEYTLKRTVDREAIWIGRGFIVNHSG